MVFPNERIAEVSQLGSVEAAALLDRARAGDLHALADFTVRAAYRQLVRYGLKPAEAQAKLRSLLPGIELRPKAVL